MRYGLVLAFLMAFPVGAQEIHGVNLVTGSKPGLREIPGNRWFWVEVAPGHFVPEPEAGNLAHHRDTQSEDWALEAAEAARQVQNLQDNRPAEVAAEDIPVLWCMEFVNAAAKPRLVCVEGKT